MPDSRFILDTPLPLTAKQLFGVPEAVPANQHLEDAAIESVWTLQQFSEVNGKPWLALREHNLDGTIQRQFTGTAEEIQTLSAANNITARPLPVVSEEQFYSQMLSADRDYELGRQFAADPSQGIPHHLAPMDLDRFSAGLNDRVFEQKIRTENLSEIQPEVRHVAQTEVGNGERLTLESTNTRRQEQQQSREESMDQSFGMVV